MNKLIFVLKSKEKKRKEKKRKEKIEKVGKMFTL